MQAPVSQLTLFGIIQASGEDAYDFLQAQLTCDLSTLSPEGSITGAWCTPQGRIITNLIVTRHTDSFYLLLHRELTDAVYKRLCMFVLRSRVVVKNLTDIFHCMPIGGEPRNETERLRLQQSCPDCVLIHHPQWQSDRGLLLAPADAALSDWPLLASGRVTASDDMEWRLHDIRAGIPWINMATTEQFLPQELGLDTSGGLSYKKGCFPGQEVIARLHYRGQVKNQLYRGQTDSDEPQLTAGTRLYPPHGAQKHCGTIVDSIDTGDRQEFLAVLGNSVIEDNNVQLNDGTRLSLNLVEPSGAEIQ